MIKYYLRRKLSTNKSKNFIVQDYFYKLNLIF